jgi:hypothetical protein
MPNVDLQLVRRAPQNNGAFRWLRYGRGLAGLANGNACMDSCSNFRAEPAPYRLRTAYGAAGSRR